MPQLLLPHPLQRQDPGRRRDVAVQRPRRGRRETARVEEKTQTRPRGAGTPGEDRRGSQSEAERGKEEIERGAEAEDQRERAEEGAEAGTEEREAPRKEDEGPRQESRQN